MPDVDKPVVRVADPTLLKHYTLHYIELTLFHLSKTLEYEGRSEEDFEDRITFERKRLRLELEQRGEGAHDLLAQQSEENHLKAAALEVRNRKAADALGIVSSGHGTGTSQLGKLTRDSGRLIGNKRKSTRN